MFPALVAAELNVEIGNDPSWCIAETIVRCRRLDGYIRAGDGVKAKSDAWKMGEPLVQDARQIQQRLSLRTASGLTRSG